MERSYAGILGPLAFATIIIKGVIGGGSMQSTVLIASLCLFVFAAIGWLAGRIASSVIDETAFHLINTELERFEELISDAEKEDSSAA